MVARESTAESSPPGAIGTAVPRRRSPRTVVLLLPPEPAALLKRLDPVGNLLPLLRGENPLRPLHRPGVVLAARLEQRPDRREQDALIRIRARLLQCFRRPRAELLAQRGQRIRERL